MKLEYLLNCVVTFAFLSINCALLADSTSGAEQLPIRVETKDNKNLQEGQQSWYTDLDSNHDQDLEESENFKRSQSWIAGYGKRFSPYYGYRLSGKADDLNKKRMQSWAAGYGKRSTANIKRLQAWLTTFGKKSSDDTDKAARIESMLSRYEKQSNMPHDIDKRLQSWMSGYGKRLQSWMPGYGKRSNNYGSEEKKLSRDWNSRFGNVDYADDGSEYLDYTSESDKRSQGWAAMYGKRNMISDNLQLEAQRMSDGKRSSGPRWFVGYGKRGPNWFVGYGKRGSRWHVGYGKGLSENDLESVIPDQDEDKGSSSWHAGKRQSAERDGYENSDDSTFTDSSLAELRLN
ncbi:hypothetical protein CHS0354_040813 [Potamilus streckersoni]|uniref:Uncharacterized protein n=1 Tax=Potamilus streckersoni TaxID=2493646 RepID=A0AAE0SL44_9BIVA|nr:hypothetical protein CHS0354_040813 [Potamilus streckersoni]